MKSRLNMWLVLVSVFWLSGYAMGQQILRSGANEPQLTLANKLAIELDGGMPPEKAVPETIVDMRTSGELFVEVVDENKQVVATNGVLGGEVVAPPAGVFDYAKIRGINKLTWEPETGVRNAIVVVPTNSGWVLAGKSLSEVEKIINRWGLVCLFGWVLSGSILLGVWKKNDK